MKICNFFRHRAVTNSDEANAVKRHRPWAAAGFYEHAAQVQPSNALNYAEKCLQISQNRAALKILDRVKRNGHLSVAEGIKLYQDLALAHRGVARYSLRPWYHRNKSEYYLKTRHPVD